MTNLAGIQISKFRFRYEIMCGAMTRIHGANLEAPSITVTKKYKSSVTFWSKILDQNRISKNALVTFQFPQVYTFMPNFRFFRSAVPSEYRVIMFVIIIIVIIVIVDVLVVFIIYSSLQLMCLCSECAIDLSITIVGWVDATNTGDYISCLLCLLGDILN